MGEPRTDDRSDAVAVCGGKIFLILDFFTDK